MSQTLLFLAGLILALFWLFFMLTDYGWEEKKRRGLNGQARPGTLGMRSERAEYEWYSWARYLLIILLTYINVIGLLDSEPRDPGDLVSPIRMVRAFSIVLLLSIVLVAIDNYWDRRRQSRWSKIREGFFRLYFWLRYPALIFATVVATKRGLQP